MPISLKNMRVCASPASTAIWTSTTDHRSIIRRSTPRHHHRRLNSYLHDQHSSLATNVAPCISELPITPRSIYRKSTSSATAAAPCIAELPITPRSIYRKSTSSAAAASGDGDFQRRKSYEEIREYLRRRRSSADIRRSPPGSSRHLLSDTASFKDDDLSDNTLALVISEPVVEEVTEVGPAADRKEQYERGDSVRPTPVYRLDPGGSRALVPRQARVKPRFKESTSSYSADESNQRLRLSERGAVNLKSSSSVSPAQPGRHQVVVLKVSLHCKGCVGKLRKHLSKLEGVASFSIDLETKRVTVTGSMSPLDVLTSISKVKNAQFWPSPSTSASSFSSSSSSVLSRSEFNSM